MIHVGRNEVSQVIAPAAQLSHGRRNTCSQTNAIMATEVPAAFPVACSGLHRRE